MHLMVANAKNVITINFIGINIRDSRQIVSHNYGTVNVDKNRSNLSRENCGLVCTAMQQRTIV